MAHFTINGVSTDSAAEYTGITDIEAQELKLDAVLRDAERLVAYYAPPPDPVTAEYTSAAADGEMRIFEYLATTEGFLSSSGIGGISENFVDFDKVKGIVQRTVGLFADNRGGANVAYIERFGA